MSEIKPCIKEECGLNIIYERKDLTYKHCCGLNSDKLIKCFAYKPEAPKRPITVQELFEAGASHVKTEGMIEAIRIFGIDGNYLVLQSIDKAWDIDKIIKSGFQFTTDRKTWHSFEVEDNA